ncbi:MAG TPA: glycoside hydrolase family 1 protein [Acidimicrobiia bacterium]|nr:glycoside hydrolase family 1 protein [Acidimicrobiia bacterium]
MTRPFPDGFEWGTATAAHQIEGGNWNNDWWAWEHTPGSGCVEPSGDACDSWHRWRDDVALVRDLGMDTYRFSIEWSRIEPEEGEWSRAAIDHYRRIGDALLEAGVRPVVTFHHFTSPRWFAAYGGWKDDGAADRFARFCERAARELAPVLHRACTLNEPNIVAMFGYVLGTFPPGGKDFADGQRAIQGFCDAHRKAVDAIRGAAPGVPVGLTLSMNEFHAVDGGDTMVERIRSVMEDPFLDVTDGDDFFGVQSYSRLVVGPGGPTDPPADSLVLPMGYEYWPQALATTIRRAWDYTRRAVPILVTENGIGTGDDDLRVRYVETALGGVLDCLDDGVDVRGYTYWSLLDNFEWAHGYGPEFGLVAVDRATFARTPKPSARWYAEVAAANAL